VVISNSPLSNEQRNKLSVFCDKILLRENKGFDFGAWKDALLRDGWENISRYDSVTLMNDTCFGPIFDLETIYLDMEKNTDFWGLTNYKNEKFGMPKSHKPIPEHIQSYFICFKKKVVDSGPFKAFWENVKYENKIEKVIQKYETQFTKILTKAGFRYSVFLDKNDFPEIKSDLAVRRPDLCMKFKVPFLKVKSFLSFPHPEYIISFLRENTNYPVAIIFDYLNQIYAPNTMLFIQNKIVSNKTENINILQNTKIAIHLHSYYPEILDKYMPFLDNTNINFDLYITTNSHEKKMFIYNYMKNRICFSKLKEIIIIENHSKNVVPWLSIKNHLNQYDIVGHFHTNKSLKTEEWIDITWLDDLLDSLLHNMECIINEFYNNRSLGIIIPEVPYIFRRLFLPDFSVNLNKIACDLWNRLKCHKTLDFRAIKNVIFPIGNMFWYRPAALKPLFELQLLPNDIPQEPIQRETILHAIEHLLVYIAWNEGYDYRISIHDEHKNSNFVDICRVYTITNSLEYRIGKYLLRLPKAIKHLMEK
jgi:rhamnosyltransferase